MTILAVAAAKGGVGKTTTAVTLAHLATLGGARVLLWDLDPQGAASWCLRVAAPKGLDAERLLDRREGLDDLVRESLEPGLDVIPASPKTRHLESELDDAKKSKRRLRTLLDPVAGRYDLVVLDTPPGLSVLAEAVARAADALVVPVVPAPLALRALDQLHEVLGDAAPPVLPFWNLVDLRRRLHRELIESKPEGFLHSVVPAAAEVERIAVERAPLVRVAPHGRATKAFVELFREVMGRIGSSP